MSNIQRMRAFSKKSFTKTLVVLLAVAMAGGMIISPSLSVFAEDTRTVLLCYGGNSYEEFRSAERTSDGGFILSGTGNSNDGDMAGLRRGSNNDALLVKLDASGTKQWAVVFGGTNAEYFYDAIQTSDGGYVAVGSSKSNDVDLEGLSIQSTDGIIVKFDSLGNAIWKSKLTGSQSEVLCSVEEGNDGYYAVGHGSSMDGDLTGNHSGTAGINDAVIAKYDKSTGNLLWCKTFGGTQQDYFYSIDAISGGGFIIAGASASQDGDWTGINNYYSAMYKNATLIKVDNAGNAVWKKMFQGSNDEEFNSVVASNDGGYVAVGESASKNGDMSGLNKASSGLDAVIVKYDISGNLIWSKSFGGTMYDYFHWVVQTSDGGYLSIGRTNSTDIDMNGLNKGTSNDDGILVKYDNLGNFVWKDAFGGTKSDDFYTGGQMTNGLYLAAGSTRSTDGDFSTATFKGGQDAVAIAVGTFVAPDKSQLEAAITNAQTKKQSDYTPASWAALQEALNDAIAVNEDSSANQAQINNAVLQLNEAMLNLQYLANKTYLQAAINNALALNSGKYTPASWAAITSALSAAQEVNGNQNARQSEVDSATAALNNAIANLVIKLDKNNLAVWLSIAGSLNPADFTPESFAPLTDAINQGMTDFLDENATPETIVNDINDIKSAIDGLVSSGIGALNMAINNASKLRQTDYTPQSWSPFSNALAAAIAVRDSWIAQHSSFSPVAMSGVTPGDIDNALKGLVAAEAELVPVSGVDKSALEALIAVAEGITRNSVVVDRWDALQQAILDAKLALNNETYTQNDIDAAVIALQTIITWSQYPDVYLINADNQNAYIYGMVDASIVSAEVTLSSYFHIDPNAAEGSRFTSPDMTVKNTSTMPIVVSAVSFKATGEAPKVVAHDKYTDDGWSQLGSADTAANIALGYTGAAEGDFWFEEESNQQSKTLDTLNAQENMVLRLQAKYGLSWPAARVFKYDSVFSLALQQ